MNSRRVCPKCGRDNPSMWPNKKCVYPACQKAFAKEAKQARQAAYRERNREELAEKERKRRSET